MITSANDMVALGKAATAGRAYPNTMAHFTTEPFMSAVNPIAKSSNGVASGTPSIGDALRATGVLDLSGKNAKYAGASWLSAPVDTIKALSPVDLVICKAKGCKTLGDLMALRVAWVPYFSESPGLKLLCAQNALRPVLMTYGVPKA